MDILAQALFLSVAANRLIEAFVAPLKKRYPEVDWWWLVYVAWLVGGGLAWLSGINLFSDYLQPDLIGRVMTALVVGGGSNLIADIFQTRPGPEA